MADSRNPMGRGRGPSGRGMRSPTADGAPGGFPQQHQQQHQHQQQQQPGFGLQQPYPPQQPQQPMPPMPPPPQFQHGGMGGGYDGGMQPPVPPQGGFPPQGGNGGHANPLYDPSTQQQHQPPMNAGGNDYGGHQQQRGYQQQQQQPQRNNQRFDANNAPGNGSMEGSGRGNGGHGFGGPAQMDGGFGGMPPQQQLDGGNGRAGYSNSASRSQGNNRGNYGGQQHQQDQQRQANFVPGGQVGLGPGSGYQPAFPMQQQAPPPQQPQQPQQGAGEDGDDQGQQRSNTRRNQPYARRVESPDAEDSQGATPAPSPSGLAKVMGRGGGRGRGGGQSPQPAQAGADSDGGNAFPDGPQRGMSAAGGRGGGRGGSNSYSEPTTPHFDGLQQHPGQSPMAPPPPFNQAMNYPQQQQQQQVGGFQQQQPERSPNSLSTFGADGPNAMGRRGRGGGSNNAQYNNHNQQQPFSNRAGRGAGSMPPQQMHNGGMPMMAPPPGGMPGMPPAGDLVGSPLYANNNNSGGGGGNAPPGGLRVGGGDFNNGQGGRPAADVAGPRLRVGGGQGNDFQQPPHVGMNGGRQMNQHGGGGSMPLPPQQGVYQQQQQGHQQGPRRNANNAGGHHDPNDGGYSTPSGNGHNMQPSRSPNSMQTYGPQGMGGQHQQPMQQGFSTNQTSPPYPAPQQQPHSGRASTNPQHHDDGGAPDLRGMPVHIGLSAMNSNNNSNNQQQQQQQQQAPPYHQQHNNGSPDGPGVRIGPQPTPEVSVGPRVGGQQYQQQSGRGGRGGRGGGGRPVGAASGSPAGSDMHDFHGQPVGSGGGGGELGGSANNGSMPGVSVVVGKHVNTGVAVQRGSVMDATQAPAKDTAGDQQATLSTAGSAIMLPAEYNWMRDVIQSSSAAMLLSQGAVKAQQCPRSGLLHMLYLLADRTVEMTDPEALRAILLEIVQEAHGGDADPKCSQWDAELPSSREYGLFKIDDIRNVAKAKNSNTNNNGNRSASSSRPISPSSSFHSNFAEGTQLDKPSRAGMRIMLVDGDLFLSNVLRALHRQDAKWFLVSETPDMLRDICSVAVTTLFTANGIDPRFIFSGVAGAECDIDAIPTSATLLQQQDEAWTAIRDAWNSTLRQARKALGDDEDDDDNADISPRRTLKAAHSASSLCSFLNDDPVDGPLRSGFASRIELHAPVTDAMRACVMTHLSSNLGYEVIRAPQLAWTQAATMIVAAKAAEEDPALVPPFYGPPEALLVEGIDRVVLAVDGSGRCLCVSKPAVLDALYVSDSASIRRASPRTNTSPKKMQLGDDVGSVESESDDAQCSGGDADEPPPSDAGMQPPAVTNSIAATLTPAEKNAAFVDFGLLTTTHPQLAAFTVKHSAVSPAVRGHDFLRAFNYRTLVPFGKKPGDFVGVTSTATVDASAADAEQPVDCEAEVQKFLADDANRTTSGVGRYRVDRLIAFMVDMTSTTAPAAANGAAIPRTGSGGSLMSHSHATSANNANKTQSASSASAAEWATLRALRKTKWRVMRGRAFLRHGPVVSPAFVPATVEDGNTDPDVTAFSRVLLAANGKKGTLEHLRIPMNLREVCGAQMPGILQYAHLVGAIRSSTLTLYAHLYDKTERPHVDSYLIRRCLAKCTSVLCALAFEELVGAMAATSAEVELHVGDGLTPTSWLVPARGRRARFSRADLDDWPLSRFDEMSADADPADLPIDLHSVLYLSTKGVSPRPDRDAPPAIQASSLYHTRRQFVAAVHLKLLDFLGYFVHPDPIECELGMYGKALASFPSSLNIMVDTYGQPNPINHSVTRQVTGSYAQQVILLIELLRTESLTAKEVVYITSANWDSTRSLHGSTTPAAAGVVMAAETEPNATLPTKPDRAAVLLGSRVACLCPISVHGPWTGFLDREIVGFSSITHHLQHALRRVVDVLAASMLVSGHYTGPLDDLAEVGAELPMSVTPSAAAGCLMRFILESADDFGVGLETPSERLSYVASVFPCFLSEDVRRRAARPSPSAAATPSGAAGTNPLEADDAHDGSSDAARSTGACSSRHTASCVDGCPDDADIDFYHGDVVKHMDGVLGELFGFWDIANHVVESLRDLAYEEAEREDGEAVRGIAEDLLLTFRHANDIMLEKRQRFGIKAADTDDDSVNAADVVGVPLPN